MASNRTFDFAEMPELAATVVAALDKSGIGMCIIYAAAGDPDFVYLGEAMVSILGRSADELMRHGPLAAVAPEATPGMLERLAMRARGETPPNRFETVVLRSDGARVPVEVHLTEARHGGRPVTIAFVFDLSERKAALTERERSEARFRKIIESAPDPVWIFDGRGLHFVNPAAVELLGHPDAASLLATDPRTFVAPEVSALVRARTMEMLATGKPLPPLDYPTRRYDGSYVLVEVSSIPIDFEGERMLLSFGRDMTERKRLDAQLALAARLTALGTMAAGVAHEINNPLTYALLGLEAAAATLARLPMSDEIREAQVAIADAREGSARVAAIVGQMRAFARDGRDGEAPGPVDLLSVLESALKLARHQLTHRARLVTSLSELPPVLGSAGRFGQVILNLLLNAVQALPDDRLADDNEICVGAHRDGEGRVVIEVRDNGRGIPDEVAPRIFEPFFTTKDVGAGTGLGLSICHGIVTEAGGTITASKAPGGGTLMRVVLPAAPADQRGDGAAAQANAVERAAPIGRDVLIVDDEPALLAVLARMLGTVHRVTTAKSADEALARLAAGDVFDVILCDIMIPTKSGMDLYLEASRDRPELAPRFLFMTGGAFTARAADFLARLPNTCLHKPMSQASLMRAIDETARRCQT